MADNKTIQKIFSLSDFRKKQLLGEIPERTRESYREYGYFGGGYANPGGTYSAVERIDYSNDTVRASSRGAIGNVRRDWAATGNSNFGYFGGGVNGNSFIYRIDYANDSATGSARTTFVNTGNNRRFIAATGNSNFGYFSGGSNAPAPGLSSSVDRIDYNNDTSQGLLRGLLSSGRVSHSGTSNSNFGYFAGGNTPATVSTVDRINYSNDSSSASVRGPLSSARAGLAATGNSNFGYISTGGLSIIDRINYSNDTATASARGPLSLERSTIAAVGNSNFGYFGSGSFLGINAPSTLVDRIDYSNDTATASVRGPLSFTRSGFAGCSSASFGGAPNSSYASNFTFPTVPNAGYFCGGGDGTNNLASIDKVDYANDTATASVRSALSGARFGLAATGNSNFGYFIAGSFLSTVDRIEYSSDTQSASLRTPILSASSPSIAAVGNNNFGYAQVSGSNINRINYFNDTVTNQGNLLNFSGAGWSSTNNRNFGYFTGGYSAPITYSGLDRIDFSNDTLVASKRSNVVSTNYGMSGFGNETFGYFGGGINFSLVRRVDYANDTSTVSIRGPLSTSVNYLASATGSQQFGYFGGGQSPGVPRKSQVDRINYSNDTAIASVRGPLPVAKSSGAATSPLGYGGAPIYFTNPLPTVLQNQITFNDSNTLDLPFKRVLGSYGYWTGGIPAPADGQTSIVNRVDYSNDTSISSRRGNVAPNKRMFSTSSANYLYSAFHRSASLCRLDFSNDTADGIARGILAASGYVNSTLSNLNFAYFQGGEIFGSNVYRLDFSNDLSIGAARGKIPNNFYADSANTVGNLNYGYFNCSATVSRLNYSNDLSIALTRGNAIVSRAYTNAGVSNNNFGYFTTGLGTNSSRVERIDYSNDLSTSIYRGNMLYSNVYASAGTGNQNFGYFGGGLGVPTNQEVQKIDYSNDTSNASLRGYLSTKMGYHNATTNARSS